MVRWMLVCLGNRLLALGGLVALLAVLGSIGTTFVRYLGFAAGTLAAGAIGTALLVLLATHPKLRSWSEAMERREQAIDPRRRFTL